jgi:predicted SnoaL-like aldol condensation-catalyzing enzyme
MESNKAIVERYFELWNTGNLALADAILASNYVDHAHPEVVGTESVKQSVTRTRQALPDFNITVEAIIGERDLVAVRAVIRRTQKGELITSRVMWFVRIINGQMTDLWTGTEPPS